MGAFPVKEGITVELAITLNVEQPAGILFSLTFGSVVLYLGFNAVSLMNVFSNSSKTGFHSFHNSQIQKPLQRALY